jgi:hypothetical protein
LIIFNFPRYLCRGIYFKKTITLLQEESSVKTIKWQYHRNPVAGIKGHQAREADSGPAVADSIKADTGAGMFPGKRQSIVSIIISACPR